MDVSLEKSIYERLQSAYEFSCGLLAMLGGTEDMLVQIHATLDDVGNPKDGVAAVAGYVAYGTAWSKFNYRWMMTLQELKIPHLHTAHKLNEFFLSDGKITDDDICFILAPFIETVKATLLGEGAVPVCAVTEYAAYDQLTKAEKKYIRPPDEHSFEVAVAMSCRLLRSRFNISDAIAVQMDEATNVPALYRRYEALKRNNEEFKANLGGICFCDDKKHPPVQAADMLANVFLKTLRAFKVGQPLPRAMRELTQLDGKPKLALRQYDLVRLRALAKVRMEHSEKMEIPEIES